MTTTEGLSVTVHYAHGDRPLCGAESWVAITTDNPAAVSGCAACLELVAEDLEDNHEHAGRCLRCRQEVSAPPEGWRWAAGGPQAMPTLWQGGLVMASQPCSICKWPAPWPCRPAFASPAGSGPGRLSPGTGLSVIKPARRRR